MIIFPQQRIRTCIPHYYHHQHALSATTKADVMENRGLTRKDLEPCIGPRGRVADIMNRTRPLTLEMIRRLADELNLPAEILIKPYKLRDDELTAA